MEVPYLVGQFSKTVSNGDIIYVNAKRCIGIFLGESSPEGENGEKTVFNYPMIIIGKVDKGTFQADKIQPGDPVRIVSMEKKSQTSAEGYPLDRKLTQEEIDVLVQKLLVERRQRQRKGG